MELERAFDTLGLEAGASAQDVESAYRRLCDDFDARIGRVRSLALRDRYAAARAELDAARAAALDAVRNGASAAAVPTDPASRAWAVLGLGVDASPLEVASAYVSLCEELDRELASAPTEALRRRCLEARAEIDAAYQHCAAAPLAAEPAPEPAGAAVYETQMATAPFEAPEPEPEPDPEPVLAMLDIDPEPDPEPPRRRRRRPLRRFVAAVTLLGFGLSGAAGYGWWTQADWMQHLHGLKRYLPLPPDPELVEAQSAAEYLRRRVFEEKQDIQRRSEQSAARVAQLQTQSVTPGDSQEQGRAAVALEQAHARTALARHLADLTERHIFSSSELAEAVGRMQLAADLVEQGETERAVTAYSEAREHLEATLVSLDEAEAALGARFEALDARDAWLAIAASAGLEPGDAVAQGGERLETADGLLEEGRFAAATPELRRASQHFRTALDDGRRVLAARREALAESERARVAAEPERERREEPVADGPEPSSLADARVAARPVSISDRAEVKLVSIPGGAFLYGCNGVVDRECPGDEPEGRRAEVESFRIDRTEVRVSEYALCVEDGFCMPPSVGDGCNWGAPGRGDHPVNCVDWDQAASYCGWVGKRLPSEQEWEKAARGTDGRTYPWGNEDASCDLAVMSAGAGAGCGAASTLPVASRDRGRSPYGLFDMAGNVLEWTQSLHESSDGSRVLRGGSWQHGVGSMRSSHREGASPELRHAGVGFRCAQGAAVVADTGPR